jgi:hypothetical protein
LREVAGAVFWNKRLTERCELRLGLGQLVFDGVQAGDDALGVAIHRGDRLTEGDRGDRGGCVGADAGERAELRGSLWKTSAVLTRDRLRRAVEIAGAGIVAKTGPYAVDFIQIRSGEALHIGPALKECAVVRRNRGDGRLLEHDLGEPDAIRVGGLAALGAPGQIAAMGVVPCEQKAAVLAFFVRLPL